MKTWSVAVLLSGAALVSAGVRATEARPTPTPSAERSAATRGKKVRLTALSESKTALAIRGRYFAPSDSGFRDVYGGGLLYGGELTRRVSPRVDAWLEASRIARKGQLTYTQESTKMSLLRVVAGARYRFGEGTLTPYAGAGLGLFRFSESNVIGDVSKSGLGALVKAGVLGRLGRHVSADLGLGYSYCQMTPAGAKIQLGGLDAGLGLAIAF